MSVDLTNKGQGYGKSLLKRCSTLCHTETQRIDTTIKFVHPSTGHSETTFCSSFTKVPDLVVLQTSHIVLTIVCETLTLSIVTEKYTVVSSQHIVTVHLTSLHHSFLSFSKVSFRFVGS